MVVNDIMTLMEKKKNELQRYVQKFKNVRKFLFAFRSLPISFNQKTN